MKGIKWIVLVVACSMLLSCSAKKSGLVILNNSDLVRTDEPVTLARKVLVDMIGTLPGDRIPLLVSEKGDTVPYQLDDLDGDHRWDELFFLVNLEPQSRLKIFVPLIDSSAMPVFNDRANVRLTRVTPPFENITFAERLRTSTTESASAVYKTEGPAWENDIIGFRNYLDARNGMDIFGKKVKRMVFGDTALIRQDYHQMQEWGMDILKVGSSLGAGAIGMRINDSLYRLDSAGHATYRLISDGPLRVVFNLDFKGWKAGNHTYDVTHRISIWGGAHCYESTVTVKGLKGGEELIAGIVNLQSDTLIIYRGNSPFAVTATHDRQGYIGELLGMGIMTGMQNYIDTLSAPEEGQGIVQSYIQRIKLSDGMPVSFRFYAGWEYQDQSFASREGFMKMLETEALKSAEPLVVIGI